MLCAVEGSSGYVQSPAVLLSFHRGKGQRLFLTIIGGDCEQRIGRRVRCFNDVGNFTRIAADGHLCVDGCAAVAAQVIRCKDHFVSVFSRFLQRDIGILPCEGTGNRISRCCCSLKIRNDAAQYTVVIGGVLRHAADDRNCAGDGDGIADIRVGDVVQIRIADTGDLKCFVSLQRDSGPAGRGHGLFQHSSRDAEGRSGDLLTGIHVNCMEAALGQIQCASRVLDGIRRIEDDLHAGPCIDGDHRFRSAVSAGILGCEHDLVDLAAVIRAKGNDGVILPREASLYGFAVRGRLSGQFHIRKARAVRNGFSSGRIADIRANGNGILLDLQRNLLAFCTDIAVVVGEGNSCFHGIGNARASLNRLANLFDRYGNLIEVRGKSIIAGQRIHGECLDNLNAGEIVHTHRVRIRNCCQCLRNDVID